MAHGKEMPDDVRSGIEEHYRAVLIDTVPATDEGISIVKKDGWQIERDRLYWGLSCMPAFMKMRVVKR